MDLPRKEQEKKSENDVFNYISCDYRKYQNREWEVSFKSNNNDKVPS